MKCPKCAYLGFETTERCRNCGYDFSLSVTVEPSSELPLRSSAETEGALSDFDLAGLDTNAVLEPTAGLDLDRLIGVSEAPDAQPNVSAAASAKAPRGARGVTTQPESATAVATPPPEELQEEYQAAPVPRPALPPLAVRRTTPEIARRRTPRTLRRDDAELPFQAEPSASMADAGLEAEVGIAPAPRVARLAAAVIDLALLGGINAGVLYLTLAIAGLSFADVRVLPLAPMGSFLLMLNGGYLIAFTAAGGQTIGKMIARIRVIGDDGGRVDVPGAIFRSVGAAVSCLALGLPYLPVLMSSDGRALHDRLAGTRVIKSA